MSRNPERDIVTTGFLASAQEIAAYERLATLLDESPVPPKEFLANLGLYLCRPSLSRILFMHDLYLRILKIHGIVVEFGVRWGQNLALFSSLRTIYEPHNYSRKIVGFDSFEGFPDVSPQDGTDEAAALGAYGVTPNYERYLDDLLATHEQLAPRSHLKKYEVIKGDVDETLPAYLSRHPETIISLAYFDLDLYRPTKLCLERIEKYLTKGSVIGFDELGLDRFPGETSALRETWGLSRHTIHRDPRSNYQSYIVLE